MNSRTHPNNSNAFRATDPRMAEVRPRRLGLAVLNFPPIPVARDGALRRLSHQMKSRSRWRRPSRALELNEEGLGKVVLVEGSGRSVERQGRRCLSGERLQNWGPSTFLPFFLRPRPPLPPLAYMQHGDTPFCYTAASCRSTSPILYNRFCKSRGVSRKSRLSHSNWYSLSLFQFGYDQG